MYEKTLLQLWVRISSTREYSPVQAQLESLVTNMAQFYSSLA